MDLYPVSSARRFSFRVCDTTLGEGVPAYEPQMTEWRMRSDGLFN